MEASASRGERITDKDIDNLIGMLMTELVKLDEIALEGDLKLQKKMQVIWHLLFLYCYILKQKVY